MTPRVAMQLARVSLLPTVWTNVLAGITLAGGAVGDGTTALLVVAMSLAYTGGMFLNDAFDREHDAATRPDRPIPAGLVSQREVFGYGFALLLAGAVVLAAAGFVAVPARPGPAIAGLALAGTIVLYDAYHKQNPASPLVMGACRMLVYVAAAVTVAPAPAPGVWLAAAVQLGYIIGLTYAAKHERLARLAHVWPLGLLLAPLAYALWHLPAQPWTLLPLAIWAAWTTPAVRRLVRRAAGDVPAAVGALLGGIAIVDAIFLAAHGAPALCAVALLLFVATMRLQRWVQGT